MSRTTRSSNDASTNIVIWRVRDRRRQLVLCYPRGAMDGPLLDQIMTRREQHSRCELFGFHYSPKRDISLLNNDDEDSRPTRPRGHRN